MTIQILLGDARQRLQGLPAGIAQTCVTSPPYFGLASSRYNTGMPDARGRFQKGEHWRKPQAFRDRDWLCREYIERHRSTGEIAAEFGVTDAAILYWLKRHGIPARSISEARALKHWGSDGKANPMFGRRRDQAPSWKGGVTPERQGFYSTREWAEAVKAVWRRDQAKCRRCGREQSVRGTFHIHHVVSFAIRHLRAEVSNLVLLCGACHRWVHSKENVEALFIASGKGGAE